MSTNNPLNSPSAQNHLKNSDNETITTQNVVNTNLLQIIKWIRILLILGLLMYGFLKFYYVQPKYSDSDNQDLIALLIILSCWFIGREFDRREKKEKSEIDWDSVKSSHLYGRPPNRAALSGKYH